MSINKLKQLIGESEQMRHGNLSGKKKVANKMSQTQIRKEHGTRLLSKKESTEKTKDWPKAKKHSKKEWNKFLGE